MPSPRRGHPPSQSPLVTLADFRPRAVVLDLDGTVLHNMPVHAEAFATFCARHGLPPFTEEMRLRLDGKRNREIMPVLFGRPLSDAEQAGYAAEKEGLYREISRGRLAPLRGLQELLDGCDRHGIPVAIATSAPAENVVHSLEEIGLDKRLTRIVRGDDMPRGKPFPDVFLAAARLLDVPPEACLAFEDAPAGVIAAVDAGMRCVALATSFAPEDFARHGAHPHLVVRDFAEFLEGPGRSLR
jgi:beta-phosphoglucomutase